MARNLTKTLLAVGVFALAACGGRHRYRIDYIIPPGDLSPVSRLAILAREMGDSIDSYNSRLNQSEQHYDDKLKKNLPLTDQERLWLGHIIFRKSAIREMEDCFPYYGLGRENPSLTLLEADTFWKVARRLVETSPYADVERTTLSEILTIQTGEWYRLAKKLRAKNVGACTPVITPNKQF